MSSPSRGLRSAAGRLAPPGTRRRSALARLVDRGRADDAAYQAWIAAEEPLGLAPLADADTGPLVSVIVPAFNTPERYLTAMVDSVLAQTYRRWELCLVDGSTSAERSKAIAGQAGRDGRIRLVALPENLGIAANTNAGLEAATGSFIAFLDHDDTLAPFALNEVVAALGADPSIDLLYSDEDKLSDDGRRRSSPFFKPGWSPDLLLCVNYLAHLVVVRAGLVRSVGGLGAGYDGAQDYDLVLRIVETDPVVHHVARVLYHWRMGSGSTARASATKSYAQDAGCRALRDHLQRRGIPASVDAVSPGSTTYRVRYERAAEPAVHVATPRLALADLPADDLLLVEGGTGPDEGGWLRELTAVAVQPGVGVVAPLLRTPEGTIAGPGYSGTPEGLVPLFAGRSPDRWTWAGWTSWPRDVVAVGGCGVLRIGLAAELVAAGADLTAASLSLAAHRKGLRNVVWPFATLVRPGTLPPLVPAEPVSDPYANPNLGRMPAP